MAANGTQEKAQITSPESRLAQLGRSKRNSFSLANKSLCFYLSKMLARPLRAMSTEKFGEIRKAELSRCIAEAHRESNARRAWLSKRGVGSLGDFDAPIGEILAGCEN